MLLKYSDKAHAYWLDGKRCKGVTSVAAIPDDKFAINQWRARMVAEGMSQTPSLVERAALAAGDKEKLNAIAEEALVAAKAHDARDRGTAAHKITERFDLGELVVDTPLARAVQAAWKKALDDAGLEILPEYVERIVVHPDLRICGTFDRIARRKLDGTLVVVDLKTGSGAVRYPHSVAIQLALYANAPLLAGPIPGDSGQTEEFTPMPIVDKRRGVIIHMPDDDHVEVATADIEAGWAAAQQIVFPALEWRARRDLVHKLAAAPTAPLTDGLKARLGILKLVDGAKERVVAAWPVGVPPRPPWSKDQAKQIASAINRIEQEMGVPF